MVPKNVDHASGSVALDLRARRRYERVHRDGFSNGKQKPSRRGDARRGARTVHQRQRCQRVQITHGDLCRADA